MATGIFQGKSIAQAFENVDWVDVGMSGVQGAVEGAVSGGMAPLSKGASLALRLSNQAIAASVDVKIADGVKVVGSKKSSGAAIVDMVGAQFGPKLGQASKVVGSIAAHVLAGKATQAAALELKVASLHLAKAVTSNGKTIGEAMVRQAKARLKDANARGAIVQFVTERALNVRAALTVDQVKDKVDAN
jgi:hypothetical protein